MVAAARREACVRASMKTQARSSEPGAHVSMMCRRVDEELMLSTKGRT